MHQTGNNVMSSTKDGLTRLSKALPPLVRYWQLHACVRTRVQSAVCTESKRACVRACVRSFWRTYRRDFKRSQLFLMRR